MVAKYRIDNLGYIKIPYKEKVRIKDVDVHYVKNLNKGDLVYFTKQLLDNYQFQRRELLEAYEEIRNSKEAIRLAKYKTTQSENKLVDVLLDYHKATRKLLK